MSIENVSPQMEKRFEVLEKMIEQGYIEPVKPLFDWLPTLCYFPNKTSNFDNAPPELKKQFNLMFSWYGFWLGIFAFVQTRLAKDFCIVLCIYGATICLLPPKYLDSPLTNVTGWVFVYFMSQIFVFSRYYQYKIYGRCPSNRNIFSTICLSIIYFCLAIIPGSIIQAVLYSNVK